MSFTVSKKLATLTMVPSMGGLLLNNGGEITLDLTITARSVDYVTEDKCGVYFDVSTANTETPGTLYYEFDYSGTEHPFTAGEAALKASLTS